MALDILQNYAEATVTTSLNGTDAAGTSVNVTVSAFNGAWAALAVGQQMRVADKTDVNAGVGYEIMILTANASGAAGSWTVTRGAEGSTVKAHTANWTMVPVDTAAGLGNTFLPPKAISQQWYTSLPIVASPSNSTPPLNRLYAVPLLAPTQPTLYDALGLRVTTSGTTGAVIRLGVYLDTGTGYPGELGVDAGTIDATVGGDATLLLATPIPLTGLCWLAFAAQGATSQVFNIGNQTPNWMPQTASAGGSFNPDYTPAAGFYADTITGALPATFPSTIHNDDNGGTPRIWIRAK